MRLITLPAFLLGSRRAILEFAENRWTLVLGLLLVLSASLARYYDGAYLLKEWDILTHGLLVAAGNALIIYTLIFLVVPGNKENTTRPRFWSGYLTFLGLFWMTAPMAWLYGIPYERFLTPIEALNVNQITLALVSVWRIALITRVLSVIFGASPFRIFFIVMLFADITMFAAAVMMPKPILISMGGIQQTEVERAVVGSTVLIIMVTMFSFLFWLIAAVVAGRKFESDWSVPQPRWAPAPKLGLALALLTIPAWIPALIRTQPEQRLRHRAESLLAAQRVEEALIEMSAHDRSEYPPVWDPAPRIGYGERVPSMASIRQALAANELAPWVRSTYMDKSWATLTYFEHNIERSAAPEEIHKLAENAATDPDACLFHADHDPQLTEAQREALREAAALVKELQEKRP